MKVCGVGEGLGSTSQGLGPDGRGPSGDPFSSLYQDGGVCLNMNGLDEMD